ncbi:beta-1,4-galactosyltransferase 6 isoform X3 [Heterocephalus glaber]|uniref:Beta-1,4-galactosyltransferase n=1 Tax=Heterocephalus glaber TaxID=10181 RepID=A0AAX6TKK1_HETGA|nr:beta-1,4-galactosyltransferase 6 isoform X3 [Heterocephalus glaber]
MVQIILKAIIQVIILSKQQRIFQKTSHIHHTSPAQKNCLTCERSELEIEEVRLEEGQEQALRGEHLRAEYRSREEEPSGIWRGGFLNVNVSEVSFDEVHQLFSKDLDIEPGGHWRPKDCKPRWKVAVLIPFRNRHEHLPIFFLHLIPMLQKQRLEFAFYVIEQTGTQPFNRAMLFNVGFKEAMKDSVWDCVIFHDVDHLPENDRNYYGCGEMPRHFAAKLDKYMYILPYKEFFGGVSGLTVEQFGKINGFPNAFWGWGGEDDDLWNRVHYAGYNVTRPEGDLGKYKSIPHHHRGEVQFLGRYKLLRYSKERQYIDGLNNLLYTPKILVDRLYTNISVNLMPELAPIEDY